MKKIFFLFFIFSFIKITSVIAENDIVYLDMDKIIQNSKAGVSILKQLDAVNELNIENLKKIKFKLKEEEEKIISQKNILSEDELKKKVKKLNENIENYKKITKTAARDLAILKKQSITKLLNLVNPILIDFSKEKNLSLILNKQNIIMGKNQFDITMSILAIVDKKIDKFKIEK